MKVLIFGARGYLGSAFSELYPGALTPEVDIADSPSVGALLDQEKPDIVINAAGRTGRPNVDWCEDHKLETLRSNATGPLVLAEECGKREIYWVHLGSGCIYSGDNGGRGFTEEDPPNFTGSFYSRSKALADRALKEFPVLVLRLRMPFDATDHPRSLLRKLIAFERVLDVQNSITYLPDFYEAAKILIEKRTTGIFNAVNPGSISPYQIVQMYRDIVDPAHTFERLTSKDLPHVVRTGRSNCVLNAAKIQKATGNAFRPVEEAVREALVQKKEKKICAC